MTAVSDEKPHSDLGYTLKNKLFIGHKFLELAIINYISMCRSQSNNNLADHASWSMPSILQSCWEELEKDSRSARHSRGPGKVTADFWGKPSLRKHHSPIQPVISVLKEEISNLQMGFPAPK